MLRVIFLVFNKPVLVKISQVVLGQAFVFTLPDPGCGTLGYLLTFSGLQCAVFDPKSGPHFYPT